MVLDFFETPCIGRIKSTHLARPHIRKHLNTRANKMCDNDRRGAVQLAEAPYKYSLLAYEPTSETQPLQLKCVHQNRNYMHAGKHVQRYEQ